MTEYLRDVLVDMDGTIADLDGTVMDILQEEYPGAPKVVRKSFYIENDIDEEYQKHITNIISRPGFFLRHKVIDGSMDAWAELVEQGYKPRICTAPLRKNRHSIQDKLGWLEENFVPKFGYGVIDSVVIDKKKFLHPALALIDDRPEIEGYKNAHWEHIVFDQPYNHTSPAQYRLLSWKDKSLIPILGSIANRSFDNSPI
jgi:5'-nucleotidase